jgi:hypothetical protein
MADNEIILKVSLDGAEKETNKLVKLQTEIDKLAAQKKALNQTEKDLAKAVKEGNITRTQYTQQLKEVKAQQVENNAAIKANKAVYRENERQLINNTKAQQLNKGSLVQLRAALARDTFEYDRLTKASRQNSKEGIALKKSIDNQVKSLKQLEKETGRTQRNVGNYGEAMNDVLPIMGGFGGQIMAVQRSLGAIQGALGKVTTAQKANAVATNTTSKSLKGFRLALIATGIGAIVIALGSLVAAFLSTQRGIDAVTSVLRPLQEVFQSLIGVVQDLATRGFDRLKKAIANPKQALEDFGNFIKDQFITRVLAIPKAFVAINKLILNSIKLLGTEIKKAVADVPLLGKLVDKETIENDLKLAKQAVLDSAKELSDAQIELTLGVDADKVRKAGEEAGKFFSEAAARGSEIDRLTKEIEVAQITLNRELAKGLRIFEEQRSIAEDTNNSTQVRLAAAAKAQEQLKANVKLEKDQINRELQLAKLKTEANDTDREAKQEIQELIGRTEEIEARALKKGLLLRNKANSIVQKAEKDRLKAIADEEKAKEKAADDEIKRQTKVIDAQIESLKLQRQLELATIDETNEEKYQKELELQDKIGALRVEKAKLNGEEVTKVETENIIATQEIKNTEQKRIDEEEKVRIEEQEAFKDQVRQQGVDLAAQAGKALVDGAQARAEREKDIELANLNARLEAGTISQEDFEKKKLDIEKRAFNKKKRLDLAVVAIDLAKEISAIAAAAAANPANAVTFGGAGVSQAAVLTGIAVARSAIQSGIIASQKFAKGGVIHGASHANGGVQIGNGIEAEGGEAIINKKSTSKHLNLLSAINQDGGGVAFGSPNVGSIGKFANGGITPSVSVQNESVDLTELRDAILEAQASIKVTNVASETTGIANRVQQIEDSASF